MDILFIHIIVVDRIYYNSVLFNISCFQDEVHFTCGHCSENMGPLKRLFETGMLSSHKCFENAENVTLNYEESKIFVVLNVEQPNNDTLDGEPSCSRTGNNVETPPRTKENYVWNDEAVKLLIVSYNDQRHKFDSPSYCKKKVWELISVQMNKHGYKVTGLKCDEKWRNLKKTYDKILKEKNTTGNESVSWKFFDRFHDIYFKDPHFNPVATTSSSGITKICTSYENEENQENIPLKRHFSPEEKHQRRKNVTTYERELKRQNRHNEKMKLKKEIFEWFKQNYKKD